MCISVRVYNDVMCISVRRRNDVLDTSPSQQLNQLSLPRWFPKQGSGEWAPVRAVACVTAPIALKAGRAVRLI